MLKKLLALLGTALLAVNGTDTNYDLMTPEEQLGTVMIMGEIYEESVPEIVEVIDEISHEINVATSIQEIPEEVIGEEVVVEEFFWQIKPLPR